MKNTNNDPGSLAVTYEEYSIQQDGYMACISLFDHYDIYEDHSADHEIQIGIVADDNGFLETLDSNFYNDHIPDELHLKYDDDTFTIKIKTE